MNNTKPGLKAAIQSSAVIYCRVSKDELDSGRSVGEQEEESREVAKNESMDVVCAFVEKPTPAGRFTKKRRPEYEALVEYLKTNSVGVIIFWEVSRIDRKAVRGISLLDFCRDNGIQIHVVSHRRTYDMTIRRDRKTLIEELIDAEDEIERLSERVQRTLGFNARSGKPHGRVLYGYQRIYDRGRLIEQIIREEQAAIIKEAAHSIADGKTPMSVARDFNARDIPTPHAAYLLDKAELETDADKKAEMLAQAYVGKCVHRGEETEASWPAILDEETFQACVDRFKDPQRRTQRDTAIKHLLSGIAVCGVCLNPLRPNRNNTVVSYQCVAGWHVSISVKALEKHVNDEVREHMIRVSLPQGEDSTAEAEREAARLEAAEIRKQMDDAIKQATKPAPGTKRLSPIALAEMLASLEPQLEAAQISARRTTSLPRVVARLVMEPEKWDDASIAEKRDLLRSGRIVDTIAVNPTDSESDRIDITWYEDVLSQSAGMAA